MVTVDLNSDVGESFGAFKVGEDRELMKHITSANIACGYHAGDHNIMAETVKLAIEHGVKIGAHPGFADLIGFGRRAIETSKEDIFHSVVYQINALRGFCQMNGVKMNHVKPHGALYNQAAINPEIAEAIAKAVFVTDPTLILYGLSGSALIKAGKKYRLTVANEVFADRTYQIDGTLTPRREPNALIHDSQIAVEQVLLMVQEKVVKTVDGTFIPIEADTVCLHGDSKDAVRFGMDLRVRLEREGIIVRSLGN
ncbi:5-oxoprolinase subunit PxpA [Bacillus suaedae]|uniref:5-oxoprolinase subunit A n=1 Tax=Halalkalibacter suaedae TaxID=2822140 RepID=A0A941ARV2_9BACI|nr:5-oxoprolinase subunit PxpA [Bacillus suaedae]MBP3953323.1 LamB/YcsF family protein [Bacillus suaedae]